MPTETINTTEIAKKIIRNGVLLTTDSYSLRELWKIRDALLILEFYGVGDTDLLWEVNKYITEKVGE